GYGRRVGPVSLGLSGHYLRGLTLSRSRLLEPRYGDEGEPIEIDYLEVLASGGHGFALDVGAAWQPVPRLTVGAAVSNLLGTMSWSDELRVRGVTLGDEDLEPGLIELRERFQTSERPLPADGSEPAASALAAGIYDRANLPASLRLGAGFAPWPGARLGASYDHALTAGELSRGWDRSLGLGVQQKLAFLGLRAGYATSLDGRSMLTGGASLGPLDVGIAKIDGTSGGYERSGWVVALGAGIRGRIGQ
ncbi:MAG TPA: DUF5723 family protein, partial [Longimicrobiaceae bacterium]|nr:DUF5723 family protein [Longimicrobiaceae bacterium]